MILFEKKLKVAVMQELLFIVIKYVIYFNISYSIYGRIYINDDYDRYIS